MSGDNATPVLEHEQDDEATLVIGRAVPQRLEQPGAEREGAVVALHGKVTANHRFLLKLHLGQSDALQAAIDEIDREVGERLDPFRVSAERLTQIAASVTSRPRRSCRSCSLLSTLPRRS